MTGATPLEEAEVDWVREATGLLAHRGPDDEGRYTGEGVALGFRRLAIVDPSEAGHQPMMSADGRYRMVYNGEIYNAPRLAAELTAKGVELRSSSDSEVLLELFALYGPACLDRVRGMFAFAVWDAEERTLFAARDPFGIKPFYYRLDGTSLRFASEKKALVRPGAHGPVDPESVRRFLSLQYVPGPGTMSPRIRVLPPGHQLSYGPDGELRVRRYHSHVFRPAAAARPDTGRRIREALEDSVAAHLRSDVPVGSFLSGGVDSAVVCALAATHDSSLQTFTVGFGREGYSEIEHAVATADALGVKSNPYFISAEEFATRLPEILAQFDEPFADAAAVALWFLAREARKQVKVVLSGEGADELFGGYHVYRGTGAGYLGADLVYEPSELALVTPLTGGSADELAAPLRERARKAGWDPVTLRQSVDLALWLPGDILTKADRMTMAHGLELRVPFLDREVLAAAETLAYSEKISPDTTKSALREAVADLVPPEVARRPKLGFPVPIRFWLRDELYDFAEAVLTEAEIGDYLHRDTALTMLRDYRRGDDFDWRRLWVLVCFAVWHRIHVEGVDPRRFG
ncbi:asparagine synthase (glutamine-hydrolyzing) [Amycolatopsis roodepoortensis]|uniref:asparagine synthase (glutamine-hydrolyzing) n=1 Tax=Amycolatopsis roodepoortensis TaxID=700274 RepID=UPI00214C35F3|nr:asparagine synthase (glutamine-hydrolyzing) [Amycolatopsis roodepoortensis]UUV31571.1 asparagine synthase (glutamine-hydrolyzing) [Amycolatopsis roodepoortensis]